MGVEDLGGGEGGRRGILERESAALVGREGGREREGKDEPLVPSAPGVSSVTSSCCC